MKRSTSQYNWSVHACHTRPVENNGKSLFVMVKGGRALHPICISSHHPPHHPTNTKSDMLHSCMCWATCRSFHIRFYSLSLQCGGNQPHGLMSAYFWWFSSFFLRKITASVMYALHRSRVLHQS